MRKQEKLDILKNTYSNIKISNEILNADNAIRGVYGIFSISNEKKCIYIGRAFSILDRFLSYDGHLAPFIYGKEKEKLVPKLISEALEAGYIISIEILKRVKFDEQDYYKDMQKLASTECQLIDQYQKKDECLNQLPEGRWISKNKYYKMFPPKNK